MTEPSEEPPVKKVWTWEDVKETLHPDLHEQCEMMWEEIDLVLREWLDWDYQGECDMKGCQTWKCVCECLWKHKGLEFCDDDYGILNHLD